MITMRRQLLGLGFVAASSLLALHAAQAMTGPTAIQIDGGPLGPLQLSGGVDAYSFYQTGTNRALNPSGTYSNKAEGSEIGSALVELQKTDGVLQFTIEVGSTGATTSLGAAQNIQSSVSEFSTGPLYAGYITIAPPGSPVTVSAGQLNSVEGYEAGTDWTNVAQFATALYDVENSQSRGVNAVYTHGPATATVIFGDGFDTGVFNYLQALFSYAINPTNTANVFYGGNLGRTGLNAKTYGYSTSQFIGEYGNPNKFATVGTYGPQFVNSQMIGAYYSYTNGNLNLVPEVQYQYAKKDYQLGISKPTSNIGAAVFGDYSFGTSPYSLGGWVEYFDSHSSAHDNLSWFLGPDSELIGVQAAPTWQYKDLFARASAGYLYLLHNKSATGVEYGYGDHANIHGVFQGALEAGLLF